MPENEPDEVKPDKARPLADALREMLPDESDESLHALADDMAAAIREADDSEPPSRAEVRRTGARYSAMALFTMVESQVEFGVHNAAVDYAVSCVLYSIASGGADNIYGLIRYFAETTTSTKMDEPASDGPVGVGFAFVKCGPGCDGQHDDDVRRLIDAAEANAEDVPPAIRTVGRILSACLSGDEDNMTALAGVMADEMTGEVDGSNWPMVTLGLLHRMAMTTLVSGYAASLSDEDGEAP